MSEFLYDYVAPKVHPLIREGNFSRLFIKSSFVRGPPAQVDRNEKKEKPCNWQRPTATVIDSTTIELNCCPGKDYLQHYASLIATFFALERQDSRIIQYLPPTDDQCLEFFMNSTLAQMGTVDVVIVGYVQHLATNDLWTGSVSSSNDIFTWKKPKRTDEVSVSFLGCMISFLGDMSGHLVRALQVLNKAKCGLYMGKTGALSPEARPNEWLATGSRSFVKGTLVEWDNALSSSTKGFSRVHHGTHVTMPTPLCETKEWLQEWQSKCSWVDCEVGYMAQASSAGGSAFGYLHIVSDNNTAQHPHNLTNERLDEVIKKWKDLFSDMRSILELFLVDWPTRRSMYARG